MAVGRVGDAAAHPTAPGLATRLWRFFPRHAGWLPGTRMSRMREQLYARQGGCCHYCGREMTLRTYAIQDALEDSDATIEHLVPRVLGGREHAQKATDGG